MFLLCYVPVSGPAVLGGDHYPDFVYFCWLLKGERYIMPTQDFIIISSDLLGKDLLQSELHRIMPSYMKPYILGMLLDFWILFWTVTKTEATQLFIHIALD